MGSGRKRRKQHFRRIHAFPCGRASFKDEHSLIGGPGFSRIVYCNDPDSFEANLLNYGGNYVKTSKYTVASFFPKSLFEQFRRVANLYFLLCALLSFSPLSPYSPVSNVLPLVVVIGVTMGKEALEDWRRTKQDMEMNNRKVKVHIGDGEFVETKWMDLRVGHVVRVEKDEFFPADLILLSSSYEEAICYVETMNLDGETNLKLKNALEASSNLHDDSSFQNFKATIKCEDPNANLYSFVGSMLLEEQQHPLSPQQLLLRDSKLRNTDFVYGVVIFTGHDTKVIQNSTDPPSKRSKIEKRMDKIDERMMDGNWVKEPRANVIQKFLQLLAICHTALPEIDEKTGKISYEAESPDEAAFVIAAREFGFEFYERSQTSISLREFDPTSAKKVERSYQLLDVLEFNSTRKRMSVIIRDSKGKLLLLCKGADSVMFERLAKNRCEFEEQTKVHVNEYADAGLRTLVLAYRELKEEEFNSFHQEFIKAKNTVSTDRDDIIDQLTESVEKDLILLGATAVEDKLQNGVPECIDKLAQAGIKIWVLTGDKMETAINIGFACSLLRQGMKQIIISSETPEGKALDKVEDDHKSAAIKAFKTSVTQQITDAKALLTSSSETPETLALIIDGKSLTYALEDDVKDLFLELAIGCASVICCRSSPKQKAQVTQMVKVKTGSTTLAVGDGANDVGMIQEADIGIGISGVEGMQAVMSSDIAIAQFRYLERLLLVHGHWCYRRISSMICYFFYKNIVFGFTLFFFEMYASFSGQTVYNDWFLSLYNVFFTSLPVIALGVFDQDVSSRYCLKFSLLYQEGVQNVLFSWVRIFGWVFNGLLSSVIIFFFCVGAMDYQAFRNSGEVVGLEILVSPCTLVLFGL
uniref:Phospholipid-transporting ATPase n=1 Tax=Cucumis sativus TaxID=3659 RepID=A0A0A0LVP6_CUCSA